MKSTPIIILNKDRLEPLKLLVKSLHKKSYENIIIIDNKSTYEPLLDWYKSSGVDVFYNNIPETLYDTGTFYRLAFELNHPKFVNLVKTHYVFTDSDVIPIDEIPNDFIQHMIEVRDEFNIRKVGLGLKIDDLPPNVEYSNRVIELESDFWKRKIEHQKYELYNAGIDTTFAIYGPGTTPLLDMNSIRMAGLYMGRHMPWYYDINNLPPDEFHYLKNLEPNRACYSWEVRNKLFNTIEIPKISF